MKKLIISSSLMLLFFASCDCNDSQNNTPAELNLVTSSNTSGKITYTNLLAASPMVKSFTVASVDSEGISYNIDTDAVVVSRTNNKLETYTGIRTEFSAGTDKITLS
jgi:hypothetical protein